jgi:hypothetical protein
MISSVCNALTVWRTLPTAGRPVAPDGSGFFAKYYFGMINVRVLRGIPPEIAKGIAPDITQHFYWCRKRITNRTVREFHGSPES